MSNAISYYREVRIEPSHEGFIQYVDCYSIFLLLTFNPLLPSLPTPLHFILLLILLFLYFCPLILSSSSPHCPSLLPSLVSSSFSLSTPLPIPISSLPSSDVLCGQLQCTAGGQYQAQVNLPVNITTTFFYSRSSRRYELCQ